MDNKYLYMVLAGVAGMAWYYVGMMPYYNMENELSEIWWFATIIAIGMGAGSTGGDDAVSALVDAIKGFVPQLITLAVFAVVSAVIYQLAMTADGINPMGIVHNIATYVAAGVLTSIMMSYLKKSYA